MDEQTCQYFRLARSTPTFAAKPIHTRCKHKGPDFPGPLVPYGTRTESEGTLTISTCANTVRPRRPAPPLSRPTSVQNRYFQRHSGAKTGRRCGRCTNLLAEHAHPTIVGVTQSASPTAIMLPALKMGKSTLLFTQTEISAVLLPL